MFPVKVTVPFVVIVSGPAVILNAPENVTAPDIVRVPVQLIPELMVIVEVALNVMLFNVVPDILKVVEAAVFNVEPVIVNVPAVYVSVPVL